MNFDKLKKTAKDAFKIVGDKFSVQEEEPLNTVQTNPLDIDDFTADDDILGNTRRFDMNDALSHFKKRKNGFEGTFSDIAPDNEPDAEQISFKDENQSESKSKIASDSAPPPEAPNSSPNDIDISLRCEQELCNLNSRIKALNTKIDSYFATSETLKEDCGSISKKLNEILVSLSGINKITDSIFDLKNAQMNTKNTLSDLETAFKRLKQKMTAGVVTLTIVSAVIVVLEIINLLS